MDFYLADSPTGGTWSEAELPYTPYTTVAIDGIDYLAGSLSYDGRDIQGKAMVAVVLEVPRFSTELDGEPPIPSQVTLLREGMRDSIIATVPHESEPMIHTFRLRGGIPEVIFSVGTQVRSAVAADALGNAPWTLSDLPPEAAGIGDAITIGSEIAYIKGDRIHLCSDPNGAGPWRSFPWNDEGMDGVLAELNGAPVALHAAPASTPDDKQILLASPSPATWRAIDNGFANLARGSMMNAVTSDMLRPQSVAANHLSVESVRSAVLSPGSVTGPAMADAAVETKHLAVGAVTGDKIGGVLDAASIPELSAGKITTGTLAADRIPDIDASKIASGTLSDARVSSAIARAADVWSNTGNSGTTPGAHFLGTTDGAALELRTRNVTAMTFHAAAGEEPRIVGGQHKTVTAQGGVIAGGGTSVKPNTVGGAFSTVGGGFGNRVREESWNPESFPDRTTSSIRIVQSSPAAGPPPLKRKRPSPQSAAATTIRSSLAPRTPPSAAVPRT